MENLVVTDNLVDIISHLSDQSHTLRQLCNSFLSPSSPQGFMEILDVLAPLTAEQQHWWNLVRINRAIRAKYGLEVTFLEHRRPSLFLSELLFTKPKVLLESVEKIQNIVRPLLERQEEGRLEWETYRNAMEGGGVQRILETISLRLEKTISLLSKDCVALEAYFLEENKQVREKCYKYKLDDEKALPEIESHGHFWQECKDGNSPAYHQVFTWLANINDNQRQNDVADQEKKNSADWLWKFNEFRRRADRQEREFFRCGTPTSGKTFLAAVVTDYLTTHLAGNKNEVFAYLCCQRSDQRHGTYLLQDLVRQLAQPLFLLPESVKQLYASYGGISDLAQTRELISALQSVMGLYSRVWIIIDAMDGCAVIGDGHETIISALLNIYLVDTEMRVFVTSRQTPEIEYHTKKSVSREISVSKRLEAPSVRLDFRPPWWATEKPEFTAQIVDQVWTKANGRALFTRLRVNSPPDVMTINYIRSIAEGRESSTEGFNSEDTVARLAQGYDQLMTRINKQSELYKGLAMRTLAWISVARKPLKVIELLHGLATLVGNHFFDADNIPALDPMITACAGLITVTVEGDVDFFHQTAHDYFKSTGQRWFSDAQDEVTTACVTYLSFDEFSSGVCQSNLDCEERLSSYPFYRYAACNWAYHARNSPKVNQHVLLKFLSDDNKTDAASQVSLLSATCQVLGLEHWHQNVATKVSGAHLVARFGVNDAVSTLHERGIKFDSPDSDGWTPLMYASWFGNVETVKCILATGTCNVDAVDKIGNTAMSLAAMQDYEKIVKMLRDAQAVEDETTSLLPDEQDATTSLDATDSVGNGA